MRLWTPLELTRREFALCDDPYPMQPVKPGLRFGSTVGGWCWSGSEWFPCDIWRHLRFDFPDA
jgi:hypothetical protein